MGMKDCAPLKTFIVVAAILAIVYVAYNVYKKNAFGVMLGSMIVFIFAWMSVINFGCDMEGPGYKLSGWCCAILGLCCLVSCMTGQTEKAGMVTII